MMTESNKPKRVINSRKSGSRSAVALLSLVGLLTGCNNPLTLSGEANAQANPSPAPTKTPLPSPTATDVLSTNTPTLTPSPWPTPTAWSTPTPWSMPTAWNPVRQALPTLEPLPLVPTPTFIAVESAAPRSSAAGGLIPVNYAPPHEVDVFGNIVLRWVYPGRLAEDEFFDIKIKPLGSESSVFVDWSKTPEYELRPWSGWSPGLYTWQIGIVKGYLDGDTKNFIADTGRDSAKFIIKWQDVGHGGGGGNGGGGGGGGGRSGGS